MTFTEAQETAFSSQPRCPGCAARLLIDMRCPNRKCSEGEWTLDTVTYLEGTWRLFNFKIPLLKKMVKKGISDRELAHLELERDNEWKKVK